MRSVSSVIYWQAFEEERVQARERCCRVKQQTFVKVRSRPLQIQEPELVGEGKDPDTAASRDRLLSSSGS